MADTTSECEGEVELDGDVLNMPFHERWAVVGSRPTGSMTAWSPANSPGSGAFASHMAGSFKLGSTHRSALNADKSASCPDLAFALLAQAKHSLGQRRIEPGSPDRLLKGAAKATGFATRVDRGDAVGDVEKAMDALYGNDSKALKLARRGRLTMMRHGDWIPTRDPAKSARDMRNKRRQRQQHDTRGQRAALSEFSRWCTGTFGDLQSAWTFVDQLGKRNVDQQEFIARLQQFKYPTGNLGLKNTFYFLDTDDDDIVHEDEFFNCLRNFELGRTKSAPSLGSNQGPSILMDPIEAGVVKDAGTTTVRAHAQMVEKVRRHDPVVAQLIEYMLKSFLSLRMAFKRMDVNGTGFISKVEFQDSIQTVQSNTGARPVPLHMQDLFARLDPTNSGFLTLDELVHNIQSDDPMLRRLKEWAISSHNLANVHATGLDDASLKSVLMNTFRVVDGKDVIKCPDFLDALPRVRYHEWHINDLWSRLDTDVSGLVTIGEFTAFLLKDPPKIKEKPTPVVPLGSEERRKKLENPRLGMTTSTKLLLAENPLSTQSEVKAAGPRLKEKRKNPLFDSPWETLVSPTGSSEIRLNRPDYLGIVQANIKAGGSELRHRGRHVLTVSSEPQLDFCSSVPSALGNFQCEPRPFTK